MTRLAILAIAVAALATPAHAQSNQRWDAPVYSFNGNVFDPPPADQHWAPSNATVPAGRSHRAHRHAAQN
jgi:hypothetical protein